jgi:hypothetical protein
MGDCAARRLIGARALPVGAQEERSGSHKRETPMSGRSLVFGFIEPRTDENSRRRGVRDDVRTWMRAWSACLRPCWSPSAARLVSERLRRSDDPAQACRPWGSSMSTSRSCARAASRVKGSVSVVGLASRRSVPGLVYKSRRRTRSSPSRNNMSVRRAGASSPLVRRIFPRPFRFRPNQLAP